MQKLINPILNAVKCKNDCIFSEIVKATNKILFFLILFRLWFKSISLQPLKIFLYFGSNSSQKTVWGTRCQFHQCFIYKFFVQTMFWQCRVWLWTNFRTKNTCEKRWQNWRQVSISSTLNAHIFHTNIVLAAFFLVTRMKKKLPKRCSYKKFVCRMLMKMTEVLPKKSSNNSLKFIPSVPRIVALLTTGVGA